jgi:hypothetical protein
VCITTMGGGFRGGWCQPGRLDTTPTHCECIAKWFSDQ